MKVEYDPEHDMMNIELLSNVPVAESIELDDGIILDYSEGRNIVSIELLGVEKRLPPEALEAVSFTVVR